MLNNRAPDPPPELTPEDMYWITGYFVVLYLVGRSGAMGWFCLLLIPALIAIIALTWDDW